MTATNCLLNETTIREPSAAVSASCLYEGWVTHARLTPVQNTFRYRLFMVYLDLGELPLLFENSLLWSCRRPAVAWFRREDHLGDPAIPLDEAVRDLVQERLGFRPEGAVRLLTNLRYWGYAMNPVSFYFCYGAQGQPAAFVAEVHNTPWGEEHCYVLPWDTTRPPHTPQEWRHAKAFHVSPFLPMRMDYAWQVTEPAEELRVEIINHDDLGTPFSASLQLQRRALTPSRLRSTLLKFPWMSGKIIAAIYWQALKLWWKGAVYYPHP